MTTYFVNEAQINGSVRHEEHLTLEEAKEVFDNLVSEIKNHDGDTSYVYRIDIMPHTDNEDEQWDLDPEYSYTHNG